MLWPSVRTEDSIDNQHRAIDLGDCLDRWKVGAEQFEGLIWVDGAD